MIKINELHELAPLFEHIMDVYYKDFEPGFIGVFLKDYSACFEIIPELVPEAVCQAWQDMTRMGELHLPLEGQNPDRHKYSAFMAKWVAKVRPIQCRLDQLPDGQLRDLGLRINAYFARKVFQSFLEHDTPPHMDRDLIYTFHHRDERGEMLSILAYTCERISQLEEQIKLMRESPSTPVP